jgi:hypothetical protein
LQVCPALSLPLIRRVLANFVPDIFSPDPISPTLLAALNTEVCLHNAHVESGILELKDSVQNTSVLLCLVSGQIRTNVPTEH